MKPIFIYILCTLLIILILGTAITLISNQQNSQQNIKAQALYITDGDTFQTESRKRPVRLANVDAPETGTPGAAEAKAALTRMILGEEVLIDTKARDTYNQRRQQNKHFTSLQPRVNQRSLVRTESFLCFHSQDDLFL